MLQDRELKQKIISQIELLPDEDLEEIDKVINNLKNRKTKRERILSFSGAWKDMDDDTFNVLIDENRRNSSRRERIE